MTTVEKLFVQIFERKNWILEQVKQQVELYDQNLASKLLIDGIAPPTWLWNPNFTSQSSDLKELNKEELISELLLPHRRPTIPYSSSYCSLYSKPAVTGDNGDLSDGSFMETHALEKYTDAGDGSKAVSKCCINENESALHCVPELDSRVTCPQDEADGLYMKTHASAGVDDAANGLTTALECCDNDTQCILNCDPVRHVDITSPQSQIDQGISNRYAVPDESLARIQRSKSRQTALKLRNSTNAKSKRCFFTENKQSLSSRSIMVDSHTVEHANSYFKSVEPSDVNRESALRQEKEGSRSKENGTSSYLGRITRSRSSCKHHDSENESSKADEFALTEMKDGGLLPQCEKDIQHPNHVNNFDVIAESHVIRNSTKKTSNLNELPKLDVFSYSGQTSNSLCAQSTGKLMQRLDDATELPNFVKSSSEIGRKTRSQTAYSNEGISKAGSSASAQPIGELIQQLDDEFPKHVKLSSEFSGRQTRSPTLQSNEVELKETSFRTQSTGNELSEAVKLSTKFTGRKTRSQTACTNEGLSKTVNSSHATDARPAADAIRLFHLENLSDNKVIPACPGTDAVNQEEINTAVVAIELVQHGHIEAKPRGSGSNVDGINFLVGSEGLFSRLPSGSLTAVKPKQLDFYGIEENNLENISCLPAEKKRMDRSSDQICCTSSELAASIDKETPCSSEGNILEQESLVGEEISPKENEAWRHSDDELVEKYVDDKRSDVGMPDVVFQLSEGYQSSLEPQVEEGGHGCEETERRKSGLGEDGLLFGLHLVDVNNVSIAETSLGSSKVDSWPQFKRRRIEDDLVASFSSSPSFRAQKLHASQSGPGSRCLEMVENDQDVVLQYHGLPSSHERDASLSKANVSLDVGVYQQMKRDSTVRIESSPLPQTEEAELGFEERNDCADIPSSYERRETGTSLIPSSTRLAVQDSQDSSIEDIETVAPITQILDTRSSHLLHLENTVNGVNADDLTVSEVTLLERKSCFTGEGLLSRNSGASHKNDLDLIGSELESFLLDAETGHGGADVVGDEYLFGTTEHSSLVGEVYGPAASISTPFSHFSSKFNPRSTNYLYKSVPNGLLESVDLLNPSDSNEDFKHIRASYENNAFTKASFSDCLPYSAARYKCYSKNLYSSPVGKLWERTSSSSGSSEKRMSSNPELTCFTIVEDPGVIEENENADEVDHKIQEDWPRENTEREPLSEITKACLHPSAPVSITEKLQDRGSLDSISTEVSLAGTYNNAKRKLRDRCRDKVSMNEAMDKQSFSVGKTGTEKVKKSLQKRFTKPKLSGKTSLKKEEQRFSEKIPSHTNIVSNITSFVPLVQQKQAAAVCTGKRDVKVRALEAAEAAKRLEEKRENERKIKKEAMKAERARIEQENLRQRELDKKKKEAEQKKKDADKAARKRQREEEEKKEKGKKRNRIEEVRRQVKMQEEKLHAGEVEKEKLCVKKDEKLNSGRKLDDNRGRKSQLTEKTSGDDVILENPEPELMSARVSVIQEAGDLHGDTGNRKVFDTLDKSVETDGLGIKKSPEKSYNISPYQCSDDEEDDEDDIRTDKFIPSWASKNCVALVLSSQIKLDPDVIFIRESFCSMDEVLVPRKLQQTRR